MAFILWKNCHGNVATVCNHRSKHNYICMFGTFIFNLKKKKMQGHEKGV